MTGKIFRSIVAAAGCALLASVLIIMGCLYDYFGGVQEQQLWDELSLAAAGVEQSGRAYLDTLEQTNSRLTWIGTDGEVLYDAEADEQTMENHAAREEVREAMRSGMGTSTRYSSTLLEKTVYCARRLDDGSVLRISVSTASMAVLVMGMVQPICIAAAVVLALALLLARRLARRIVEPLERLDLDNPLENQTYDELAPLLTRISQQRRQIDGQLHALEQKTAEFEQITNSMNEGLVLLNEGGVIVSINPAARRLFHAPEEAAGMLFLDIERSRLLDASIENAMRTGRAEVNLEREGREYQIDLSRIGSGSTAAGVVLLIFDITERAYAERMRREFTANVSHELKTPLTAILGSSELLQNGMVKAEDMPRFVGHIHAEAARLLLLIEDILRLSQLDEGAELPRETVDLGAVAGETVQQLQKKAEEYQVTLRVQAEPCPMRSVSRLVREIMGNLTENAIKYNVPGGSVDVSLRREGTDAILTVSDTGIGIPPEYQGRVFERFYRVDKSHSRQTGGTGLGLSIVKHACAYLGAAIELQSEPDRGTTVCVRFAGDRKED